MNTTDWSDVTKAKEDVFCFDIDGTLADHKGLRSPYDEFKVYNDLPIEPVLKVLRSLLKHYKVIFLSGRSEACRHLTKAWLNKHVGEDLEPLELYMRKIHDKRRDDIVKKEIYDNDILPQYNVIGVFDDRMQVCRMLYENNIFCFNVNQGLREF